ncbi:MAG: hypothetical protein GX978_06920 [Tissierellia bacterium]|nr:hypothetical protein [Tissierellia bacterium]
MQDILFLWILPIFIMIYFGWGYLRTAKGPRKSYFGVMFLVLLAAMIYRHVIRGGM